MEAGVQWRHPLGRTILREVTEKTDRTSYRRTFNRASTTLTAHWSAGASQSAERMFFVLLSHLHRVPDVNWDLPGLSPNLNVVRPYA